MLSRLNVCRKTHTVLGPIYCLPYLVRSVVSSNKMLLETFRVSQRRFPEAAHKTRRAVRRANHIASAPNQITVRYGATAFDVVEQGFLPLEVIDDISASVTGALGGR